MLSKGIPTASLRQEMILDEVRSEGVVGLCVWTLFPSSLPENHVGMEKYRRGAEAGRDLWLP